MEILKSALLLLSVQLCSVNTSTKQHDNLNEFLFNPDKKFDFINLSHNSTSNNESSGPYSASFCIGRHENEEEMWKYPFNSSGRRKTILDVPTDHLIVPLIIADISDKVNDDSKFVLHRHHLDYFLNNYFGRLYQPCFIVFKFGWSRYFRDRQNFYAVDENTTLNYPGMSEDIAKWIPKSYKNVVGIGVDLPSVDPSSSADLPAFKALTDAGVYVVTNVNLDQYIPEWWCTAIITPLNIKDVCSPYRLIAACPKSKMIQPEIRLHRL